ERSTVAAASPDDVYPMISDFRHFEEWSPWAHLDPAMKTTLDGTPGTVGASYAWVGNDKVGEGKMTFTAVTPKQRVDMKLEFIKPWKANNDVSLVLAPDSGKTKITWSMDGHKGGLMGK